MSPTLIEDVNLDDVLNMLAYINFEHGIPRPWLKDGLDILLAESGQWDTEDLARQIEYRTETLAGNTKNLGIIRDVTLGMNSPLGSYNQTLARARRIKNALTGVLDLKPETNMSEIPF